MILGAEVLYVGPFLNGLNVRSRGDLKLGHGDLSQ